MAHCTLHTLHITLNTENSRLHQRKWRDHSVRCTGCSRAPRRSHFHVTLQTAHNTAQHTPRWTLHCTEHSTQHCTAHSILHTAQFSTLQTFSYTPYWTLQDELCTGTMHNTLRSRQMSVECTSHVTTWHKGQITIHTLYCETWWDII